MASTEITDAERWFDGSLAAINGAVMRITELPAGLGPETARLVCQMAATLLGGRAIRIDLEDEAAWNATRLALKILDHVNDHAAEHFKSL